MSDPFLPDGYDEMMDKNHMKDTASKTPYTSITQAVRIAAEVNKPQIDYVNNFKDGQATPSNLRLLDRAKTHLAEQSIFNPVLRAQLENGIVPQESAYEINAKATDIRAKFPSEAITAKSNDAVLNLIDGDERKAEAKKVITAIEIDDYSEGRVSEQIEELASRMLPIAEKHFRDPRAKGKPMIKAAMEQGLVPEIRGAGDIDRLGKNMALKADAIKDRAAAVLPLTHLGPQKSAAVEARETGADLLAQRDFER